MIEPVLPMEAEQLPLLLRAMNSYYSNKIEGQHAYPADLELALQQQFSSDQDVRRRQELAIAHMQVEAMLEPEAQAMEWGGHFSSAWVQRIHRELYQRLDEESRGVSAIKRPNPGYTARVFAKAGAKQDPSKFEYELGWVYVLPSAQGRGIASALVEVLVPSLNALVYPHPT